MGVLHLLILVLLEQAISPHREFAKRAIVASAQRKVSEMMDGRNAAK